MNNEWVTKALLQWKSEGIELNPPSIPALIKQAEEKLSFIFPDSFKCLYLMVDGFKDNDWRENMFSIWPIERILYEYNKRGDKAFVGFSDFLLNSHALGFYKDLD
ncbi:MAG TPA: SMI1/KNR4 family protein, partial [Chitinophagaceae bacterium]|nr:SMI1/KNR4 family protein [Chitinophagaceae bacterium]